MEKIYKVAIIGGGFSGLICAEVLSANFGGEEILVLEKNDRVGKKILATGNGRGNFTNLEISEDNYHSVCGADFIYPLRKYGNKSIIGYFRRLGVDYSEENGRVYPSSFQANSILDTLRSKLEYLKTDVRVLSEVVSIKKKDGVFKLFTNSGKFFAEKVIYACGGCAGKQYGTDGSSYKLLTPFGHRVTETFPSLVQMKTDVQKIKGLKGLKQQATVSLIVNGRALKSFTGDLLFTDYGVSGNTIFNLSAYIPPHEKCQISISFLPDKTKDEVAEFLCEKLKTLPYVGVEDVLTGVINKQIGRAIVKDCGGISRDYQSAKKIAEKLKDFRLNVNGTLGFDSAQVTKGGFLDCDVSTMNMQSKWVDGLYIVGEALDVDGDCGGYNLQWAYSSAMVACEGIIGNED